MISYSAKVPDAGANHPSRTVRPAAGPAAPARAQRFRVKPADKDGPSWTQLGKRWSGPGGRELEVQWNKGCHRRPKNPIEAPMLFFWQFWGFAKLFEEPHQKTSIVFDNSLLGESLGIARAIILLF